MALPSSVTLPSASSAPSEASSARASLNAARGGGSRNFELARVGDAPHREIERQAGEIGGENLRLRERREAAGRRLLPQPVADARLDAAGAAAPLVGVGARDAHRLEPRQADVGLVARHAHQAAVDDDAHAFDGQRGLGDRGRQHDLAPALAAPARRRGPARARPSRRRAARRRRSGRARALRAARRRAGSRPGRAGRRGSSRSRRRARARIARATSSSMRAAGSRPR